MYTAIRLGPAAGRGPMLLLAALILWGTGCGPNAGPERDRTATSLVYSPGAQVPSDREGERPAGAVHALRPGVRCRIHLRRDAAGLSAGAPVSIVGTSRLSELASVSGVVEAVDEQAVTLRGDGSTYWIPRTVILAVEFSDERRP